MPDHSRRRFNAAAGEGNSNAPAPVGAQVPPITAQVKPQDTTTSTIPPTGKIGLNATAPEVNVYSNGVQAAPNTNATLPPPATTPSAEAPKSHSKRPGIASRPSGEVSSNKGPVNDVKQQQQGRRGSFFSSFSSKFSSSSPAASPRNASIDASSNTAPPAPTSPKVEFGNPFNKTHAKKDSKDIKKEEKVVVTPVAPRRQSVLVHAGQERKVENPGFLSSALRRLSSSNSTALGKAANTGAICPRRVMNVDQNRERVKIPEFDQKELKRVAFCVDVEIAGYAQHGDEPDADASVAGVKEPVSLAMKERQAQLKQKRESKDAKYKDKGEGTALKHPQTATQEKEDIAQVAEAAEDADKADDVVAQDTELQGSAMETTTRKKEKKKRSEAERKERREKKRKRAEANGEVPLEFTARNGDDSDSGPGSNGSSTPAETSDHPTTDPLRIYKRCCQLRETAALKTILDQIARPSSTLSEIPGTVAVLDLSGIQLPLQDIMTLGDWLAVVPVRKVLLDDCGLTDEGVRVILSGLASCKSVDQAKQNRKLPKSGSGKRGQEQLGVVQKLSLKNNQFTALGWKHIALFLHVSRSIKAIDLSGNPFPSSPSGLTPGKLSPQGSDGSQGASNSSDTGSLVVKALTHRFGDKLEELILSSCTLNLNDIGSIVECAINCKIKRLGLADNNLSQEALVHIGRYIKMDICQALDLGSNDLHDRLDVIFNALERDNTMFALSLADCNLTPSDLGLILPPFAKLNNFRFLDLSHNQRLFSSNPNAVPVLRRHLPKMTSLRRVHLADVGMSSDDLIAITEILPECPALAHISVVENDRLVQIMNATDDDSQEEACALFASLMTAARVSQTMMAIEIEVPGNGSSEVVRALASQVVAYTLRNMERSTLTDYGVVAAHAHPEKAASEVLLHLVGTMDGYDENHDNDEPAPDEDYMIASTGIVKALRVCLATDGSSRAGSRNMSPTASGSVTPRPGTGSSMLKPKTFARKKPRNVTLELCESARKIRMRLRPALVREDRAGNDLAYRERRPLLDCSCVLILAIRSFTTP